MIEEIVIVSKGILWFLGTIVTVGAASAVFSRWGAPYRELKKRVERLETYQNADHKELQKVETGIEKICKCTLAITDHELTGNGFEKLQKAKEEMQDYLIEK